jgi:hypothetical protein
MGIQLNTHEYMWARPCTATSVVIYHLRSVQPLQTLPHGSAAADSCCVHLPRAAHLTRTVQLAAPLPVTLLLRSATANYSAAKRRKHYFPIPLGQSQWKR